MKNITSTTNKGVLSLLILLFAGLVVSNAAYAQKNSLKTNLANFAISGGSLQFEHILGESSSAQLGVFIAGLSVEETKFSGFGLVPQYRFYPGKNLAPHGFFVAPLLSYQAFALETTSGGNTYEADYSLIGAGLDIGKQWLFNRSFSIELSLGVTFNSTNLKLKTSGASENDFNVGSVGSTAPRMGLSLGYAF